MNTQFSTRTHFRIVLSFIGSTPNSYAPGYFTTEQEARDFFKKEYRDRNKGDEYDKYWNNIPLVIQEVVETIKPLCDERLPEQIADSFVHNLGSEGKWSYLIEQRWVKGFGEKQYAIEAFIKNEMNK